MAVLDPLAPVSKSHTKLLCDENDNLLRVAFRSSQYAYYDDQGFVNVEGDVDLCSANLSVIPIPFGVVTGNFDCRYNQLTDLRNSPREVGGSFLCNGNQLRNLMGAPEKFGSFHCSGNVGLSIDQIEFYRKRIEEGSWRQFRTTDPLEGVWVDFEEYLREICYPYETITAP